MLRMLWFLVLVTLLVGACAAPPRPSTEPSSPPQASTAATPKSLVVAITIEPPGFGEMFGGGTSGPEHLQAMLHRNLAQPDEKGDYRPEIVAELPSQEAGTWQLLADGRMETTWRLRPNVRWHDGAAFTPDDVVFSWQVALAPDVPYKQRQAARLIEDIVPVDAQTFVIRWKSFYLSANRLSTRDLFLLPRHLLEDSFINDRTAFVNSSYWNTDFVGVGPYRLVRWEPGAFAQLESFEGFYGDAPRIKSIVFRFVKDTNTALANILAGEIDVMLGRSLGLEHAQLLKEQWESRGAGQVVTYPRGIFEIRLSPGDARVADLRVRQALYASMDREGIVRDLYFGLLDVAHSYIFPGGSGFDVIDARTTRHPYDLARAAALLAELGWRKAGDGLLHNERGATYELPFSTTAGNQEREALQTVIADMWRAAGFDVHIQNVPLSVQSSEEYNFSTTDLSGVATDFESNMARIDGRYLKSPQNPRGSNVWGYANPEVDRLLDEWARTLQRDRAIEIEAAVIHRVSEDLPILPVNYRIEVLTVGKGISGVPHRTEVLGNSSAWNVERWDRQL
jgi:peptide/nickel transport system substrate-binding protein